MSVRVEDTPRSAYSVLSRNATIAVVGWLLAFSAAAWLITVRQAGSMSDMVSGLGQVGVRAPNDMTIPVFLAMWVGMMVAMMFPTVAPIVLMHRMVVKKRGGGELPTVAFVAGYLLVWSVIGVVPLLAFLGFGSLSADAADARWLSILAGGIVAFAGAYQFTRWKAVCIKACRSPLGFVMSHDFDAGTRGALRAGVAHGAYCLGCCWALMSVLVVVGLMNLVWMGALSILFLAEKNWRHGLGLTKAVGVALLALGLSVVAVPDLLSDVSGGGGGVMRMDDVGTMDDGGMDDGS